MSVATVGIAGAGAWGLALANAAAAAGRKVVLWGRDPVRTARLAACREDDARLPGVRLATTVAVAVDAAALGAADAVLFAVPAQAMRTAASALAPSLAAGAPAISCAKGLERGSLLAMTRVLAEALPGRPAATLSGPSFAADVARGLPTAVTLAATDVALAEALAAALASPTFRLYHTGDVVGVEIGGAAKNVLAIAAGIAAGRGLGASAGAALIARGFAELRRLGAALGARPETLMGLSGLGDLVLTATAPQSRNFALGVAIGAGRPRPAGLAEGAFTADALAALAARHGVDMPIATAVAAVLAGASTVEAATAALLARPLRPEG
ncbi:MAG TPA: NAD(P)H-dependent glycerol-3-phosphate dehydrogenase [Hyphomicrobiales bacterium]|nr:NAD(P)H-dependent glycerol-3-phosphate dehydrogenase [Hyphomicrobiales bacterium]